MRKIGYVLPSDTQHKKDLKLKAQRKAEETKIMRACNPLSKEGMQLRNYRR